MKTGYLRNNSVFVIVFIVALSGCYLKVKVQTKQTCVKFLKEMSYSWQMDSIGLKGSRSIIYVQMQERCDIVGMNWSEVKDYFGKPNMEGTVVSKYNLRYYSKIDSSYNYPVLEYISVDLDNERKNVVGFQKRFIDPW